MRWRASWARPCSPNANYYGLCARVNNAPGSDGPVWLLQPMTYMNLSGKSVAALARFFKIEPEQILAIHDELDLLPGEMKFKQGGGNGGHNGLKDMQAQLGSANFWRLRLGIGHPGHKGEVAGYVLRKPPLSERELLQDCIAKSMERRRADVERADGQGPGQDPRQAATAQAAQAGQQARR